MIETLAADRSWTCVVQAYVVSLCYKMSAQTKERGATLSALTHFEAHRCFPVGQRLLEDGPSVNWISAAAPKATCSLTLQGQNHLRYLQVSTGLRASS